MPANSPNPFVVGIPVPPEKFIGRKSIIQTAFDQIYHRSHLAVWGGLGTGKTSLLTTLASPDTWKQNGLDPSSAVIVYFSCEELQPFTSSGFWTKVISLLKARLDHEPELQNLVNTLLTQGKTSKDSLRQILSELGRKQKFLVLLIDDYDAALFPHQDYSEENMQQFLSELRSLAVHADERRNLSVIVTSKKRLNDIRSSTNPNQSPWYNHYLFRQIKTFDNYEVDQLLKLFGITITQELREPLGEIAAGHPTLLQLACYLLYQELRNGNRLQIDKLVTKFIDEFESSARTFFASIWHGCDSTEKSLLMLMLLSKLRGRLDKNRRYDLKDVDLIFTQNQRILTNLEEKCIIKRSSDNVNYIFISSLMEQWVIEEIWNSPDDSLQQRQIEFLNIMSHQQVESVKNAIVWVKNKNNRQNVISAFNFLKPIVEQIIRIFPG